MEAQKMTEPMPRMNIYTEEEYEVPPTEETEYPPVIPLQVFEENDPVIPYPSEHVWDGRIMLGNEQETYFPMYLPLLMSVIPGYGWNVLQLAYARMSHSGGHPVPLVRDHNREWSKFIGLSISDITLRRTIEMLERADILYAYYPARRGRPPKNSIEDSAARYSILPPSRWLFSPFYEEYNAVNLESYILLAWNGLVPGPEDVFAAKNFLAAIHSKFIARNIPAPVIPNEWVELANRDISDY